MNDESIAINEVGFFVLGKFYFIESSKELFAIKSQVEHFFGARSDLRKFIKSEILFEKNAD